MMTVYRVRRGFLHGLSPVTKLMLLPGVFLLSLLSDDPFVLAGLTAGLIAVAVGSRLHGLVWSSRVILGLLFVFPAVMWTFMYQGMNGRGFMGIPGATTEGVLYGSAMGLRLVAMLVAGLLLLGSTRVEEIAWGLTRFGLPYRLSFALTLAFRLVPLFFETYRTIEEAQRSRGLDIRRSALERLRGVIPLLIPVFVAGLRRTDQLAVALEAKGFGRPGKRTSVVSRVMRAGDWIALAATVLLIVFFGVVRASL